MARPIQVPQHDSKDARLYCDYSRLVRLQAQAEVFSLLPHLKAGSVLSGRHNSLFRGRGLNFEELRHYQLGDDIRNLDWKVTMRTGKPHVRSYTEEKDRNVIILVDQRSSMFFASKDTMKSVVAAEVAAMCGWRILKDGDRVGFIIATPECVFSSKPQRSQNDLLAQFKRLVHVNQSLSVTSSDSKIVSFQHQIQLLKRMKLRQSTIILISDWHDCQEGQLDQLKQLQRHNDLLAVQVRDPMEQSLPSELMESHWVVGDGRYQINLNNDSKLGTASERLQQRAQQNSESLTQLMAIKKLPFIELSTSGNHIEVFQQRVGGR